MDSKNEVQVELFNWTEIWTQKWIQIWFRKWTLKDLNYVLI